jgi:hypothetical protein
MRIAPQMATAHCPHLPHHKARAGLGKWGAEVAGHEERGAAVTGVTGVTDFPDDPSGARVGPQCRHCPLRARRNQVVPRLKKRIDGFYSARARDFGDNASPRFSITC